MAKIKKALPRRQRNYPQTARIFSKAVPSPLMDSKEQCFVPLQDYRELEKKYYGLFRRYQRWFKPRDKVEEYYSWTITLSVLGFVALEELFVLFWLGH